MDCPGIFNWHSKHNTKYSVLWKHKRGLPNGTQMKKCKNTPFGRPYKGKEVLLWKADKVMVRLSIVKIEVWPFKTLFIYSYILSLSLSDSNGWLLLYRQGTVADRQGCGDGEQRLCRLSAVAWFWRCVWYFEILTWQAVKSENDTSKLGLSGDSVR